MREVVEIQGDHLQETLVLLKDQFSVGCKFIYTVTKGAYEQILGTWRVFVRDG
jgi:hypothetical protein